MIVRTVAREAGSRFVQRAKDFSVALEPSLPARHADAAFAPTLYSAGVTSTTECDTRVKSPNPVRAHPSYMSRAGCRATVAHPAR